MREDIKKHIRIIRWALSMFRNEHIFDQQPKDKSYFGAALRASTELIELERKLQNTK